MRQILATMVSVTFLTATLAACGGAKFHRSVRSGAEHEQTGGAALGKDPCLNLGNPGIPTTPDYPGQNPGQYPGQNPGPVDSYDPYPTPDKGYEPNPSPDKGYEPPPPAPLPCSPLPPPPPPSCDDDDGDVYTPVDQGGYDPNFYPSQHPIDPNACGKGGIYCDNGNGPGQWPGQTVGGQSYDQGDVQACMNAYHSQGYDTHGQWGIEVRQSNNVSVLSHSTISDFGTQPKIVIIKSVSVLGSLNYELLNPNALYCIKSNVSVLENVYVSSCHGGNVVFGTDVNVLSRVATRVVDCR